MSIQRHNCRIRCGNPTICPFFAAAHDIRLERLNAAETGQLLHYARGNLHPKYDDRAMQSVYNWTAGQPLLTQMLASYVMRRYNQALRGDGHDPIIEKGDIRSTIADPEFLRTSKSYCLQLLEPAALDVPGHKQILREIAQYPGGISDTTLFPFLAPNLPAGTTLADFKLFLNSLAAYDLVKRNRNGQYTIPIRALAKALS